MDVRHTESRTVRSVARGLERLNARYPWNHNDHYHPWLLRRLPARRRRALDVGCGSGRLLARLAPTFAEAVGLERDATMVAAARERLSGAANVTVWSADFVQAEFDGRFDLITFVASLHHLDLDATFARTRELLAPRGRMLVIGLSRPASATDLAWDLASAVANPIAGAVLNRLRRTGPTAEVGMPVRDPTQTFAEVVAAAGRFLPGARVRHRLYFRYTMEWTAPG